MESIQKQNHLFWRAGFGPTPDTMHQSSSFNPKQYVDAMLKASEKKPVPFHVVENVVGGPGIDVPEMMRQQQQMKSDSEEAARQRKMLQQQNRQAIKNLNLAWIDEMVNSPEQLREKMAFFWHGHFACRSLNSIYQQQLVNIIREHALSDFGTLLLEVSKSAAMLQFLNNQQNRKNSPNENFAREVMELFTVGRGNYTERDVKEAARAFTGWGFNVKGEFQFRPFLHDTGEKTVLGESGKFEGEDVLQILLRQKQTARFICTKLYRFYVNDQPNPLHIDKLADMFFKSGYQITPLLKEIFTADWFYAKENIGTRIKSPIELLVGIRRQLPMEIEKAEVQFLLQNALSQTLFYPPNVAGWPGGKTWIDSSSLLLRMKIPQLLVSNDGIDISLKNDDDNDMGQKKRLNAAMNRFNLNTKINWESLSAVFDAISENKRYQAICSSFLQSKSLPEESFMKQFIPNENKQANLIIALMSLPEYQLC